MRPTLTLALLLSASTSLAGPVITSVTPNSGPVAGGTQVTIKGSGFSDPCAPPKACPVKGLSVYFGGIPASSTLIDPQTIVSLSPPHLPGTVSISLQQLDGGARLDNGFTFVGNASDAFDRILFPLLIPPVSGAFGAEFITSVALWNSGTTDLPVYGLYGDCSQITCVPSTLGSIPPRADKPTTGIDMSGSPGAFVYVPKGSGDFLAAELRVQDFSRQAQTWGTEIPIARDRDFRTSTVALLDLPNDDHFRMTLRVYGDQPGTVHVRIVRTEPAGVVDDFVLQLTAPVANLAGFQPAYASFSAFPAAPITAVPVSRLRVEIDPLTPGLSIWAFVSVTNNDTQHITIISPH